MARHYMHYSFRVNIFIYRRGKSPRDVQIPLKLSQEQSVYISRVEKKQNESAKIKNKCRRI